MVSISQYKWFHDPDLKNILSLLNQGNDTSCIVGGAIRDSLMHVAVKDIDIATTILPHTVIKLFSQTNYKSISTGISYGTIKIVLRDKSFDITTLRSDIKTYGRNADVVFTKDWYSDAIRRDFTINALYADQRGEVIDYVGGLNDIKNRTVKFIGNAHHRIQEDYLRILRFFRFFARYGQENIHIDGLIAIKQNKEGLKILSVERIWSEIRKLLEAEYPIHAVIHMHDSGIFKEIFPYIQNFSVNKLSLLVQGEQEFGWSIDPLLRFMALIPLRDKKLVLLIAKKLCLPREIKYFFVSCVSSNMPAHFSTEEIDRLLYINGKEVTIAQLKLFIALNRRDIDDHYRNQIIQIIAAIPDWIRPVFPLTGNDVLKLGISPGKRIGEILSHCEKEWINSSFHLSYQDLIHLLKKWI
ncbi:MAG: CCA tRNA nucleotidyltransferase [Candidatus Liberibacter ctenarytainae]|uniref:CCA tRNA nucleotidyltransferase n=1 Tax=Candidatus Liberibacter ctenarytainae TaxID=2020335 RepID=A0A937AQU7_9HYPH|nr:CCA tRNA nucleotidyltransferase [Candidatus Liberibacter ctenarytainae]